MSGKSGKDQGKEFTTTLQANTEAELDTMIKGLQDYAHSMGIEEYEVIQKRPDPDGGWEATIKAHNWNGIKWLKEKFGQLKGKKKEKKEIGRQEKLAKLKAKKEEEEEEEAKARAELEERRRRKAEKEALKEAKLAKKHEIKEAKEQAEQAKRKREETQRELKREKHPILMKVGEKVEKILSGKPGKEAKKQKESRVFREGAYGKTIEGKLYFWKTSSDRKWQLQNSAREFRESGYATKIVKKGGKYHLYYRLKSDSKTLKKPQLKVMISQKSISLKSPSISEKSPRISGRGLRISPRTPRLR